MIEPVLDRDHTFKEARQSMFLQTTRQLLPAVLVATSTSTSTAVARRNRRAYALVQNADASIAIRIATTEAALAGSGGKTLAAGEIHRHDGRFPLFAKAASGTPNLIVMEFVDTANPVKQTSESSVDLTKTAALVASARDNRFKAVIENQDSTFDVTLVGLPAETVGIVLAPGVAIDIYGQTAIYGFAEAVNEVQTVTVDATGGTFTLTYAGQTTSALAENAAAATVQTALEALSNLAPGDVTVTGSAGGPYTLTFGGTLANTNVAQLTSNAASLTGGAGTVTHGTTTAGGSGTATVSVSEALYN